MGEAYRHFRHWLAVHCALNEASWTLSKDAGMALSFLADYRIHEVAAETLKRMPKVGTLAIGAFQDILRQVIRQFES
jgi:hypothetical protein